MQPKFYSVTKLVQQLKPQGELFVYLDGQHYFNQQFGVNCQLLKALDVKNGKVIKAHSFENGETLSLKYKPKNEFPCVKIGNTLSEQDIDGKVIQFYPHSMRFPIKEEIEKLKLKQISEALQGKRPKAKKEIDFDAYDQDM